MRPKQPASWFSMFHLWMIMFVFSCIVFPILKYFDEDWVGVPILFDRSLIAGAVWWGLAGLVAFLYGYKDHTRRPARSARLSRLRLRQERLWYVWAGTLMVAAVIPLWAVKSYGIDFLLFHRDEAFRGQGITAFLCFTLINYSSIFALLLFKLRKAKRVLVVQAVFVLLSSFGSRGLLVIFLLGVGLMSFEGVEGKPTLRRSRLKLLLKSAAVATCIVMTFGLVFLRQSEDVTAFAAKRALTNTFEEGEMFSLVRAQYSNRLLYGQSIWDIRYVLFPRQFFPNKPFIYGKAIFEQDLGLVDIYSPDDPLVGESSVFGQVSELYANFGGLGVLLGMFAWGHLYAWIDKLRQTPITSLAFFVYLQMYFYQLWFFRHGILGLVQSMIIPVFLAPIFVKLAYARISRVRVSGAVTS